MIDLEFNLNALIFGDAGAETSGGSSCLLFFGLPDNLLVEGCGRVWVVVEPRVIFSSIFGGLEGHLHFYNLDVVLLIV